MKTLYLDCGCGISGDMAAAGLLSLGAVDSRTVSTMIDSLGLGCTAEVKDVTRNGIAAKEFCTFSQQTGHIHRTLPEVKAIIDGTDMPGQAKQYARSMFTILAKAEAAVHQKPLETVTFHEVGSDSSIVDLCTAALALDALRVDRVTASPLKDGSGEIECAHGTIPVPVPATLEICRQNAVPLEVTGIQGEMVTPTGAAFAAAAVDDFSRKISGTVTKIGYGAGQRKFPNAGVLRAVLCETREDPLHDQIILLETNIDDCIPEVLSYAMDKLLDAGARDVWFTPIYMKKNRPAYMLSVLCKPDKESAMEELIFSGTSSIGVRRSVLDRVIMDRKEVDVKTPYGTVKGKQCTFGSITKLAPEYDSVKALAEKNGISILDIYRSFPQKGEDQQ